MSLRRRRPIWQGNRLVAAGGIALPSRYVVATTGVAIPPQKRIEDDVQWGEEEDNVVVEVQLLLLTVRRLLSTCKPGFYGCGSEFEQLADSSPRTMVAGFSKDGKNRHSESAF